MSHNANCLIIPTYTLLVCDSGALTKTLLISILGTGTHAKGVAAHTELDPVCLMLCRIYTRGK